MIWPIVITLACLGCSAVFSGFENGILAVRQARLDHALQRGSRAARAIAWFRNHPAAMLGTVLLGNNLSNCFAAIYYDVIVQRATESWVTHTSQAAVAVSLVSSGILTLVVLIGAEITPKVFFRESPLARVGLVVMPIFVVYIVTWPVVKLLSWLSDGLNRLVTAPTHRHHSEVALMREDFRMLLIESEEAGYLDKEARQLLDNSLDYHHQHVGGMMTPRVQVKTLPATATLREAIALSEATGFSRFPVTGEHDDKWVGIFSVYDAIYLRPPDTWDSEHVGDHQRPLIGIDHSSGVHQILPRSRRFRSPLLAVVDDQGEPLGIVTAGNVIEPLFGVLNA